MADLSLTGTGAAYLRVSGDKQETQRQVQSIRAFEARHGVKIAQSHRYEDDMPRDLSDKRPDFRRMMKAAEDGVIQWIVVDHIDRFGFKDEWELVKLIGRLRDVGCRLYDSGGDEWTARGLMSFFKAGLAGHSSRDEQLKKSYRSLGGMVAKARAGEWMGAPPKLGFDVACFARGTGRELWRVVWEGRDVVGEEKRKGKMRPVYHIRRRKVFPGGRAERLDGNVTFKTSEDTEVLRIVPTRDKAKLKAAQGVFKRYATETATFFDLAKWLNGLGIRNSFGHLFQSRDISKLLTDEAYLGYPTFGKRRNGRFHRFDAEGGVQELEPELRGRDTESDPADVIRSATRLFPPLVDRATWAAVQKKLSGRRVMTVKKSFKGKPGEKPREVNVAVKVNVRAKNEKLYFAGLIACAGCGQPMIARADRLEYYCGTWDRHRTRGSLAESPCERNGIKHSVVEQSIDHYLDETGTRLELLRGPIAEVPTDRLREQEARTWSALKAGMERVYDYLLRRHPDEYKAIIADHDRRHAEMEEMVRASANQPPAPPGALMRHLGETGRAVMMKHADDPVVAYSPHVFEKDCLAAYRANFDLSAVKTEVEELEAEHTRLTRGWSDLPTPRAKEKAKAELAALEARIAELEKQQEDAAEVVEAAYRELNDLDQAVRDARKAMGAADLRRRAEALRGLLCRIDCEFVATGKKSAGSGNARSKLVSITFHPIAGDAIILTGDGAKGDGRDRSFGNP